MIDIRHARCFVCVVVDKIFWVSSKDIKFHASIVGAHLDAKNTWANTYATRVVDANLLALRDRLTRKRPDGNAKIKSEMFDVSIRSWCFRRT